MNPESKFNQSWGWRIATFFKFLFFALLISVFAGGIVMLLWNNTVSAIFGFPEISYLQGFGILLLSRILFGSWGGGHRHHDGRHPMHHWKNEMRHKLRHMTPEQKAEFKDKLRNRMRNRHECGNWYEFFEEDSETGEEKKENPTDQP
ncbi:MAG: hypothetical protein GC181_06055 [Bacteroidetes bacterium]|nr:hypothetical protein [Bacteroidota bacterium]